MNFSSNHGKINFDVKTYDNKSNNSVDVFKNTVYDDVIDFDFKTYNDKINYNIDFSSNEILFDSALALANSGGNIVADTVSVLASLVGIAFEVVENAFESNLAVRNFLDFTEDVVLSHMGEVISSLFGAVFTTAEVAVRTCASIANLGISILEGGFKFIESIGDTALAVVGGVATIGTAIYDLGVGIFTGDWSFPSTNALWTDAIMPAIGYSWHDAMFDKVYQFAPFNAINDLAYDVSKRGGMLYDIGESVGYYTGIIIATTATCGLTTTTSISTFAGNVSVRTVAQAGWVTAGSMGKNLSENWNMIVDDAKKNDREVTMGDVGRTLGLSAGDAVITGGTFLAGGVVGDMGFGWTTYADGAIKASSAYLSEGWRCLVTGDEYNLKGATLEATAIATSEAFSAYVGECLDDSFLSFAETELLGETSEGMIGDVLTFMSEDGFVGGVIENL